MTEQRKTVPPPIVENIPLELRQRPQWVCWAYEWRGGKWTKVPYTPHTTKKARSNAASSWRTFQAAHSCYLERPDFFDGIGFMFSKDDPYVGGDIDHCISEGVVSPDALALLPVTYAEISPSGEGIKFIARAQEEYGRKTAKGELYSSGRFFTITGRVLPDHEQITDCQADVDSFLASLGGAERSTRAGTAGTGSRAANAAAIPKEDWEEGRRLLRENINGLLARLRASAPSKTNGKETQLYYLLKEDYQGFQKKWPGAGIIRGDGSIDSSQIRAVFANSVRNRGFAFPQYIALFYHFFGVECLAKWGTTQGFREEAATLWARGRTPRAGEALPIEVLPAPRGRAGSHTELLERAYTVLQNYRAGTAAIVTLQDVGNDLGVHKGTAHRAINDLVTAKRITKRRHGQHGGLIIHFLPESIYENPELIYQKGSPYSNGKSNQVNGAEVDFSSELIYSDEIQQPNTENTDTVSAEEEKGNENPELIYSENDKTELSSTKAQSDVATRADERENENAHEYIYISNTVYLPAPAINSEKPSIADAVSLAFDELPKSRTLESTGELKRWPVSAGRVEEFIQAEYADRKWPVPAIRYWIDRIRKRRRSQPFEELRGLRRDALEKKAASARKRIARAEEQAVTAPMPELRDWYAKEARRLGGGVALLAWEMGRRDSADEARIASEGYSLGEQAEMLKLVKKEYKPERKEIPRASLPSADVSGLVARLKARKEETQ